MLISRVVVLAPRAKVVVLLGGEPKNGCKDTGAGGIGVFLRVLQQCPRNVYSDRHEADKIISLAL